MSLFAFVGAIETGLLFGFVALGIFLSFRVLKFPDVTVDGSFTLGGAVAAILIVSDVDPYLSTLAAIGAGMLAGLVTACMNVFFGILHLFAGILTMIALYSVNLRIMGRPNVPLLGEETVLSPIAQLPMPKYIATAIVFLVLVAVAKLALDWFLSTRLGLAMRATGANPKMARAQGASSAVMTLMGIAMANGLVGLAGALFAQNQGSADVTMGIGLIMIGLASVIAGEALLSTRTVIRATLACVIGSVVYRLAVGLALNADFIGLEAQDLNLITAVLVVFAIVVSERRRIMALKASTGAVQ